MEILKTTYNEFGFDAYLRYGRLIGIALRDLSADSQRNGTVPRPELGVGVRSYHLRHSRERARLQIGMVRRPRHLILYRQIHPTVIGIGRVLHDRMEAQRHLPGAYGDD